MRVVSTMPPERVAELAVAWVESAGTPKRAYDLARDAVCLAVVDGRKNHAEQWALIAESIADAYPGVR